VSVGLDILPLQGSWRTWINQCPGTITIVPDDGIEYLLWKLPSARIRYRFSPGCICAPICIRGNRPGWHKDQRARAALARSVSPIFVKFDGMPCRYRVVVDDPASAAYLHCAVVSRAGNVVGVDLASARPDTVTRYQAEAMGIVQVCIVIRVIVAEGVVPRNISRT